MNVAVIGVIEDGLPVGLVVHRVRERAIVVDALVSLAQAHGFPFIDLTSADGAPLCVKTDRVRQIWVDAVASQETEWPTSGDDGKTFHRQVPAARY